MKRKQKTKNIRQNSGSAAAASAEESWSEHFDKLEQQVKGQKCVICDGDFSGSPFAIFESAVGSVNDNEEIEEELKVVGVCSSACREEYVRRVHSGYYLREEMAKKSDVR